MLNAVKRAGQIFEMIRELIQTGVLPQVGSIACDHFQCYRQEKFQRRAAEFLRLELMILKIFSNWNVSLILMEMVPCKGCLNWQTRTSQPAKGVLQVLCKGFFRSCAQSWFRKRLNYEFYEEVKLWIFWCSLSTCKENSRQSMKIMLITGVWIDLKYLFLCFHWCS